MHKLLIRIVAFALVPCLVVDPVIVSAYTTAAPISRPAALNNRFSEQALVASLVSTRLARRFTAVGHTLITFFKFLGQGRPFGDDTRPYGTLIQSPWGALLQECLAGGKHLAELAADPKMQDLIELYQLQGLIERRDLYTLKNYLLFTIIPEQETRVLFIVPAIRVLNKLRHSLFLNRAQGVAAANNEALEIVWDAVTMHHRALFPGMSRSVELTPNQMARLAKDLTDGLSPLLQFLIDYGILPYRASSRAVKALNEVTTQLIASHRDYHLKVEGADLLHYDKPYATVLGPLPEESDASSAAWTPAVELLDTLGLSAGGEIQDHRIEWKLVQGSYPDVRVERIRIPDAPSYYPGTHILKGLALLPQVLEIPAERFDLLYSGDRLLAIFAELPKGVPRGRFFPAQRTQRFLDLSGYYFNPPLAGTPGALTAWAAYLHQLRRDHDIIAEYKRKNDIKTVSLEGKRKTPIVFVAIDRLGGSVNATRLSPNRLPDAFMLEVKPDIATFMLMDFPTVAAPDNALVSDYTYYNYLNHKIHEAVQSGRFNGGPIEPYIVGPGSGINIAIIGTAAGLTHFWVSGKNPLEIANVRVLARTLGWQIETRVHDNVLSPEGTIAFPHRTFDLVEWNGPVLTFSSFAPAPAAQTLRQLWDGNFGLEELNRYAEGLNIVLSDNSPLAIFWSAWSPPHRQKTDFVSDALEGAGLQIEDSERYGLNQDVQVPERIYAITRPPASKSLASRSGTFRSVLLVTAMALGAAGLSWGSPLSQKSGDVVRPDTGHTRSVAEAERFGGREIKTVEQAEKAAHLLENLVFWKPGSQGQASLKNWKDTNKWDLVDFLANLAITSDSLSITVSYSVEDKSVAALTYLLPTTGSAPAEASFTPSSDPRVQIFVDDRMNRVFVQTPAGLFMVDESFQHGEPEITIAQMPSARKQGALRWPDLFLFGSAALGTMFRGKRLHRLAPKGLARVEEDGIPDILNHLRRLPDDHEVDALIARARQDAFTFHVVTRYTAPLLFAEDPAIRRAAWDILQALLDDAPWVVHHGPGIDTVASAWIARELAAWALQFWSDGSSWEDVPVKDIPFVLLQNSAASQRALEVLRQIMEQLPASRLLEVTPELQELISKLANTQGHKWPFEDLKKIVAIATARWTAVSIDIHKLIGQDQEADGNRRMQAARETPLLPEPTHADLQADEHRNRSDQAEAVLEEPHPLKPSVDEAALRKEAYAQRLKSILLRWERIFLWSGVIALVGLHWLGFEGASLALALPPFTREKILTRLFPTPSPRRNPLAAAA